MRYMFIDGGYLRTNFSNQMQEFYGTVPDIDFQAMKMSLKANRIYYYDAIDDTLRIGETPDQCDARCAPQRALHEHISSLPTFHVRDGRVRRARRQKNREQKGVDVLLAVEAMEHAARGNMEQAIILTGDLDFEPLLESLLRLGVGTRLIYAPLTCSKELQRAADETNKMTLEHFWTWSAPSFRADHKQVRLLHHESAPMRQDYTLVRQGKWAGRKVMLMARNGAEPHRLYVAPGNDLNEASYTFEYFDIDNLPTAFELTFGPIAWS